MLVAAINAKANTPSIEMLLAPPESRVPITTRSNVTVVAGVAPVVFVVASLESECVVVWFGLILETMIWRNAVEVMLLATS